MYRKSGNTARFQRSHHAPQRCAAFAGLSQPLTYSKPVDVVPISQDITLYTLTNCLSDRLLDFGNLSQDWSDLVLADLGCSPYERLLRLQPPDSRALRCRGGPLKGICTSACVSRAARSPR
jgi:hypothetical protein